MARITMIAVVFILLHLNLANSNRPKQHRPPPPPHHPLPHHPPPHHPKPHHPKPHHPKPHRQPPHHPPPHPHKPNLIGEVIHGAEHLVQQTVHTVVHDAAALAKGTGQIIGGTVKGATKLTGEIVKDTAHVVGGVATGVVIGAGTVLEASHLVSKAGVHDLEHGLTGVIHGAEGGISGAANIVEGAGKVIGGTAEGVLKGTGDIVTGNKAGLNKDLAAAGKDISSGAKQAAAGAAGVAGGAATVVIGAGQALCGAGEVVTFAGKKHICKGVVQAGKEVAKGVEEVVEGTGKAVFEAGKTVINVAGDLSKGDLAGATQAAEAGAIETGKGVLEAGKGVFETVHGVAHGVNEGVHIVGDAVDRTINAAAAGTAAVASGAANLAGGAAIEVIKGGGQLIKATHLVSGSGVDDVVSGATRVIHGGEEVVKGAGNVLKGAANVVGGFEGGKINLAGDILTLSGKGAVHDITKFGHEVYSGAGKAVKGVTGGLIGAGKMITGTGLILCGGYEIIIGAGNKKLCRWKQGNNGAQCTTDDVCLSCAPSTTGMACTSCAQFYTLMGSPPQCQPCDPNCKTCTRNGVGKCDDRGCLPGYSLDGNNTCQVQCAVDNVCLSCGADVVSCGNCAAGFTLSGTPASCLQCDPNCQKCDKNGPTFCDPSSCNDGFSLNSNNVCTGPCTVNAICLACTSDAMLCSSCASGFTLTGTPPACQQCDPNCKSCNTNGPGFCDPDGCSDGFALGSGNICLPKCMVGSVCLACAADQISCATCAQGLVLSGTPATCLACGDNCNSCNNNRVGLCDAGGCRVGFSLGADKKCAACKTGCLECPTLTQCIKCKSPTMTVMNDGSGMCSDRNPYDCASKNPCSSAAYKAGQMYFIDTNPTMYIQCSDTGDCWEMTAPPNQTPDQFVTSTMQNPS